MTDKDKAMREALAKVWQDWADSHKPPPNTMTLGDTRHLSFETRKAVFFGYQAGLSARIPEWWKLVPVEPTDEMYKIAIEAFHKPENRHGAIFDEVYKAMLSAAPAMPMLHYCTCSEDDEGNWVTTCGCNTSISTARYETMNFCCYCGGKLKEGGK